MLLSRKSKIPLCASFLLFALLFSGSKCDVQIADAGEGFITMDGNSSTIDIGGSSTKSTDEGVSAPVESEGSTETKVEENQTENTQNNDAAEQLEEERHVDRHPIIAVYSSRTASPFLRGGGIGARPFSGLFGPPQSPFASIFGGGLGDLFRDFGGFDDIFSMLDDRRGGADLLSPNFFDKLVGVDEEQALESGPKISHPNGDKCVFLLEWEDGINVKDTKVSVDLDNRMLIVKYQHEETKNGSTISKSASFQEYIDDSCKLDKEVVDKELAAYALNAETSTEGSGPVKMQIWFPEDESYDKNAPPKSMTRTTKTYEDCTKKTGQGCEEYKKINKKVVEGNGMYMESSVTHFSHHKKNPEEEKEGDTQESKVDKSAEEEKSTEEQPANIVDLARKPWKKDEL